MIWGAQWTCGCGWSNFEARKKCRHCGLPASLKVSEETPEQVMADVIEANQKIRQDPK